MGDFSRLRSSATGSFPLYSTMSYSSTPTKSGSVSMLYKSHFITEILHLKFLCCRMLSGNPIGLLEG